MIFINHQPDDSLTKKPPYFSDGYEPYPDQSSGWSSTTLAFWSLGCVTCSARSFYDHENAMENAMKTLTNAMKTLTGNADLPSGKLTV